MLIRHASPTDANVIIFGIDSICDEGEHFSIARFVQILLGKESYIIRQVCLIIYWLSLNGRVHLPDGFGYFLSPNIP